MINKSVPLNSHSPERALFGAQLPQLPWRGQEAASPTIWALRGDSDPGLGGRIHTTRLAWPRVAGEGLKGPQARGKPFPAGVGGAVYPGGFPGEAVSKRWW